MVLIWAGLLWVYFNLPGWTLFLIAVAAVIWEIICRWRTHFRPSDPYQLQLTSASHGAAFILLAPLMANAASRSGLPSELVPWIWPAALAAMAYGSYLLALGWSRTRMYQRDAQLSARAAVKVAAGIGVLIVHGYGMLPLYQLPWMMRPWAARLIFFIGAWFVITGVTKLVLLWRTVPELDETEYDGSVITLRDRWKMWKMSWLKGWGWR